MEMYNKNQIINYIKEHNTIILIDGSYFVFYRYYAVCAWLKLAHKESYKEIMEDPINNLLFVEKFHKFCEDSFAKIYKKYGNKNETYQLIISKDCPRNNIWRLPYYSNYKSERKKNPFLHKFFEYFYNNIILKTPEKYLLISHPDLESDDCIAILTKNIEKTTERKNIIIISSDKDYLQLVKKNNTHTIQLIDLKFKEISNSLNNKKDLFEKIVNGDKSDNIKPICNKSLSKEKITEYFKNQDEFINNLTDKEKENFERNKLLIDFENIPKQLQDEFLSSYILITN